MQPFVLLSGIIARVISRVVSPAVCFGSHHLHYTSPVASAKHRHQPCTHISRPHLACSVAVLVASLSWSHGRPKPTPEWIAFSIILQVIVALDERSVHETTGGPRTGPPELCGCVAATSSNCGPRTTNRLASCRFDDLLLPLLCQTS